MKTQKRSRRPLPLLPLIFSFLLLLGACKPEAKHEAATPSPAAPAVEVRVAAAGEGVSDNPNEVVGTLEAVHKATLSAKVTATIAEMPVVLGATVNKGDLLVRLQAAEIAARLSQAETAVAQAKRNLEREQRLLAKDASTRETVKAMEEAQQLARAAQDEARAMLGYTTIRAPFSGRVSSKPANAGDLATAGMPLMVIENTGALQAVAAVPETLIATLKPGDSLAVRLPDLAITLAGTVAEIAPTADALSRTATVKLNIQANAALRPGQFVRVVLPGPAHRTLLVPEAALSLFGQMERLFVVEKGSPSAKEGGSRVHLRLVRSGRHHEGQVEILSGLNPGEQVVVQASSQLNDGQEVRLLP